MKFLQTSIVGTERSCACRRRAMASLKDKVDSGIVKEADIEEAFRAIVRPGGCGNAKK